MPSVKFFIKKNLLTFTLIFLVYSIFFATHVAKPTQTSLKVLGADTNITLFIEPNDGRQPILDAINSAQKEVLVEVYLLSDKQIIQSLEDAKSRGVTVDVMLEQHPFGGGNLNNKSEKDLKDNDISFEWTNSSFTLTHEKSIVIDSSEAFILNQNLTASSFTKNREYDILDTNPQDVAQVRSIFIADWQRKPFSPQVTHLIVSPVNSRAGLTNLISTSTQTIDIEIEDIADDQITSLLENKAKAEQIRIIVPTLSQISSNKKNLEELKNAGVKVKTLSSPYVHAKLILVDGVKAYTGSVNLSTQSMDQNRELGIMFTQSDSIESLSSTFESDWQKASDLSN